MIRRPPTRNRESGFALLLIFVLAAGIAIGMMMQLPRVAFETARNREQMLIERGEQYKRAIGLFYRKTNRLPQKIEDLENTNSIRFLRRRYIDPMTGKDEWRIIHAGPGGVLTDSLVKKTPTTPDGKPVSGQNFGVNPGNTTGLGSSGGLGSGNGPGNSTTSTDPADNTGEVNQAVLRRPSDRTPQVGGAGSGQATQNPNDPTQAQNTNPQQGQPIFPGQPGYPAPGTPGYTGQPIYPGQTGYPQQQNQQQTAQQTGQPIYPGQPGYPAPGTPGYTGQPIYPGQPGYPQQNQQSAYNSGQNIPGAFNPQQTGNPNQPGLPQVPGQQSPYNTNGPQNGVAANNSALGMIGDLIRNPRGGPGTTGSAFNNGGVQGGIAGVATNYKGPSIKIYKERQKYQEWEFVYDIKDDPYLKQRTVGGGGLNQNQNQGLGGNQNQGSGSTGFNNRQR